VFLAGLSKKITAFQRPLQVADTHEGTLGREAKQMPGKLISIYRYQHLSLLLYDAVSSGKYFRTFGNFVVSLYSRLLFHEDGGNKVTGNFVYLAKDTPPHASSLESSAIPL